MHGIKREPAEMPAMVHRVDEPARGYDHFGTPFVNVFLFVFLVLSLVAGVAFILDPGHFKNELNRAAEQIEVNRLKGEAEQDMLDMSARRNIEREKALSASDLALSGDTAQIIQLVGDALLGHELYLSYRSPGCSPVPSGSGRTAMRAEPRRSEPEEDAPAWSGPPPEIEIVAPKTPESVGPGL